MDDKAYMRLALEQAEIAASRGEVPVGAIVADSDRILGRGHNLREGARDPTAHAEMIAIREASAATGAWRLGGSTLYVTLEPCIMCMGAIVLARVARLVFGARDPKGGAAGSLYDISADTRLNHRVEVAGGVLKDDCSDILRLFFERLRARNGGASGGNK